MMLYLDYGVSLAQAPVECFLISQFDSCKCNYKISLLSLESLHQTLYPLAYQLPHQPYYRPLKRTITNPHNFRSNKAGAFRQSMSASSSYYYSEKPTISYSRGSSTDSYRSSSGGRSSSDSYTHSSMYTSRSTMANGYHGGSQGRIEQVHRVPDNSKLEPI